VQKLGLNAAATALKTLQDYGIDDKSILLKKTFGRI